MLRVLLGSYCGVAPDGIVFDRSCRHCGDPTHGKPRLAGGFATDEVRFNATSSGDFAVVALSRSADVGIDAERLDPEMHVDPLLRFVAGSAEVPALEKMPETSRQAAFLSGWTQKEAYLKGLGVGIALGLGETPPPHRPLRPPSLPDSCRSSFGAWTLCRFVADEEYLVCLAARDSHAPSRLSHFELDCAAKSAVR